MLLQLTAYLNDLCLGLHRLEEWAAVAPGYLDLSSCAAWQTDARRILTLARRYKRMQKLTSQTMRRMPKTSLHKSEACAVSASNLDRSTATPDQTKLSTSQRNALPGSVALVKMKQLE